ncbi:hypothetical protein [Pseudomonas massiliensis]|uniref:hypothetical protein n=1 Tax=Pseudomonas massiliensis TaxID=522492 RepID=UPI00165231EA|nr:hypothetical protein [Pseudomonas massiliensis]
MNKTKRESKSLAFTDAQRQAEARLADHRGDLGQFLKAASSAGRSVEPLGRLAG